ncbi:MAG: hypothetical protein HOV71_13125 [Hamadaea sp.]|uniref:DUF6584 family protein n=1 Tax=Hamadaea sp. NPDC050747 TaxID=3155789 RepID=UPI00182454B7|nr:hypothetical protein [Hamadaea sp.]NUT07520.1 hypothetical protein [Hamadaea sp.]
MAKADVLARVKRDLAAGHTYLATQRLRTLVASHPDDLEIYRLLCSVYRQTGNLAEAGRWGFLTDEVRPDELAAFARVHADPWSRVRLLRWTGDPATLAGPIQERLTELLAEAERSGPPEVWVGSYRAPVRTRGSLVPCLFTAIALGVVVVLAGIGAVRAIVWLVE